MKILTLFQQIHACWIVIDWIGQEIDRAREVSVREVIQLPARESRLFTEDEMRAMWFHGFETCLDIFAARKDELMVAVDGMNEELDQQLSLDARERENFLASQPRKIRIVKPAGHVPVSSQDKGEEPQKKAA